MQTSYFANLKKVQAVPGLVPVSIALGSPFWFKGAHEFWLKPTREMLTGMPKRDFDLCLWAILDKLDPREVYDRLAAAGEPVLLCWEKPPYRCHRRLVAEWFEYHLGIDVPEFGYDSDTIPSYEEMPEKQARARRR